WHHAVMGVDLKTDAGPRSVLWTNTFYPYGVEVDTAPMRDHLVAGEYGPQTWSVTDHPEWQARLGEPVTTAVTDWATIHLGPSVDREGRVVEPARSVDVPVALRVDVPAGPVWFIAAQPEGDGTLSTLGDEIVIAF